MISRKVFFLILLLLLVLLTLKGISTLDPDFGWHLRIGQLILTLGIPQTDPFSYTMPSYHFVDHEWLTDIALAYLYPLIGYVGIAVIFASLTLFALYLVLGRPKDLFTLSIFTLAALVLIRFQGVRPQVISWFCLALLLRLLNSRKFRWFIPPLFLIWANLHGGFVFGLIILVIFTGVRFITERKINLSDVVSLAMSFGVTLFNPYGLGLWQVVWESAKDSSLHSRIGEWVPFVFSFHLPSILFLALSLSLFAKYRSKHLAWINLSCILFLIAGLITSRNFPLWVMIALPLLIQDLNLFRLEISKIKYSGARFRKISAGLVGVVSGLLLFESIWLGLKFAGINTSIDYPKNAVVYLRTHLPQGQIFADYDWGGYLIWQLPEKRVFIDGRMPSWRREIAPAGESIDAFAELLAIQEHPEKSQEILKKYDVSTILWPNPDYQPKDLFQLIKEQLFGSKAPPKDSFIESLQSSGWKKVYSDDVSTLLQVPVRD
ncbi:hypothetical protein A2631_05345 [Candidatus Daviesbacteria bacterium RIFCSPHIGHO2_01_FULL_44_29]|uniref:Glycosyltransferase RgtA/B/C/D-like domain-containing protein n=1 Tax=Candidatus Daviesbacteria bacterium RIFCSPHIGHO2_02_FULL_43_12 TaxID=1797776 RepID=A0A1F5KH49_9BACT|nr:MAG: hypothetical protein A2631_05345 [Candidatus Daviesbacteria bacterium RIFCSPHIGHO2_01_FULL_44_29]OGE40140.1 MAG: hypothetical protein A3D25_05065 [Candidatus Daviesbacteria bacterium RIFCSPHIGHO2_02_FULL_43_12]OGE70178.1 MAG: hypothetical protein A3B55_00495 [Candidatus Daviesbacteria bacterium RIFCSPLOWO2_01_FULL_43_15]